MKDRNNVSENIGKKFDFYFVILLFITICYLLLECAFNATLLDIAGADVNIESVHAIEFWGRIISGIAVALAFCGTFLFSFLHKRNAALFHYIAYGIIAFAYLISLTYYGQKKLIDSLVENSTAEQRRIATLVTIASEQLKSGKLLIEGFDLSEDTRETPSTKTFIASFASIVSFLPNAEEIIRRDLDNILLMNTVNTLGTVDAVYHGVYQQSLKRLEEHFKKYGQGITNLRKVLQNANNEAEQKWQEYLDTLKKNGMRSFSSLRARHKQEIRKNLQKEGLNLPANWEPSDKRTFIYTFIKQYEAEALQKAESEIKQQLPNQETLPLNLNTFEKFIAHETIQKFWKEELAFPLKTELKLYKNIEDFQTKIYTPLITHITQEKKEMLLSKADSFGEGQEYEEIGNKAFEASIISPIAIGFSILGVIIHLCKASFYSFRLLFRKKSIAILSNLILFSLLLAFPMLFPTPITSSEVYESMEENLSKAHPLSAISFRWILQAQSFIYPVNEFIRENVFNDIRFGIESN